MVVDNMGSMQRETFKYFCLPGIIPAIRELFMGGFSHAAWFIAFIYQSVGLLPADHPYLRSANRGQYGIRHVIAQESNNLVISIRNIDQIIVFFMILVGIILVFVQVFLVCAAFLAEQHVLAQGYTTDNLILSPTLFTDILSVNSRFGHGASGGPGQDLAFIILYRVFGLTGATSAGGGINYIYGSCISDPAVTCVNMRGNPVETPTTYPFPIHTALHDLIEDAHTQHGHSYHINAHSMPASSAQTKHNIKPADFSIGTRDGTTCENGFVQEIRSTLEGLGYFVPSMIHSKAPRLSNATAISHAENIQSNWKSTVRSIWMKRHSKKRVISNPYSVIFRN